MDVLTEVIRLHDQGVAGDKEAVVKANELMKELLSNNRTPTPLVLAYQGSITSLLGRDAIDPTQRISLALKGLKMIDRAVKQAPDDLQIRTLRGFVCYRLPEVYFHRTTTAVEDFTYLASRYEQDNKALAEGFYWQILYDLGGAYKNLGRIQEARATWTKLLEKTTDPKYEKLLKMEGVQKSGGIS